MNRGNNVLDQIAICSAARATVSCLLALYFVIVTHMPHQVVAEDDEMKINKTPLVPAEFRSEVVKTRVEERPFVSVNASKNFNYCATISLRKGPKRSHYFSSLTRRVSALSGASMDTQYALQYFAQKLVNSEKIPEIGVDEEFMQRLAKKSVPLRFTETTEKLGDEQPDSPLSLHVFAETSPDATQAARFFVYLVETTALQPTNQEFVEAHARLLVRFEEISKQLEDAKKERDALPESTERYGSGELDALKERSRFLQVDRSGLEARITACRRISQEGQHDDTHTGVLRVNAAEKLLVEAEIQLIGVVAELKEVKNLVSKIETDTTVREKRSELDGRINHLGARLNGSRKELEKYKFEFQRSLPLDIVDNTIVVQKIK